MPRTAAKKLPESPVTQKDFFAIPENNRYDELIDGEHIEKAPRLANMEPHRPTSTLSSTVRSAAAPSGSGRARQARRLVARHGGRDSVPREQVFRPEVVGWRRERDLRPEAIDSLKEAAGRDLESRSCSIFFSRA